MNLALILTAIRKGAQCANHVAVVSLLKDETGKVNGARVRDTLHGGEWQIRAKSVVNATGPFTDSIRLMDDPHKLRICVPSQGVHIVLPAYYWSVIRLASPRIASQRALFALLNYSNYRSEATTP